MMDYHIPALLKESVDGLNIRPAGIYVDLTFGAGGHSLEILKRLKTGKLIAFDQDIDAEKNVEADNKLIFARGNFRYFQNFLRYFGYPKVDGIIADLGISSFHIDNPERGFSYRFDSPIDMRMNKDAGLTAAIVVNTYDQKRLSVIFSSFGEVENPGRLAEAIVVKRKGAEIETTGQLLEAIKDCIPGRNENKYLSKVFQAIRIEVNNEIEVLKMMLEKTPWVLNKNGRLVVLTYNSLEDRIVKNFMKSGKFEGEADKDIYGNVNVPFEPVNKKPIIPGEQELSINNRARSAKLRIATRI